MNPDNPVDLSYLKQIRALARPGAPDILCTVSEVFLTQAPQLLAAIADSLNAGDFKRAAELAHKLKSTTGNLGARPLFAHLDRFETLGPGCSLQERLVVLEEIRVESAKVHAILEQGLARGFDTIAS